MEQEEKVGCGHVCSHSSESVKRGGGGRSPELALVIEQV